MPDYNAEAHLQSAIRTWAEQAAAAEENRRQGGVPRGAGNPGATISIGGTELSLSWAATQDLAYMLDGSRHQLERRQARADRNEQAAQLIAAAVRDGVDGGALVASALHVAAERLYKPWYLIAGRPGSWEATIVERMAAEGGGETDPRVNTLADLFFAMGEAVHQHDPEDGGDTLSLILGRASDLLGSVATLAGELWGDDMDNLACQYAGDAARATSRYR